MNRPVTSELSMATHSLCSVSTDGMSDTRGHWMSVRFSPSIQSSLSPMTTMRNGKRAFWNQDRTAKSSSLPCACSLQYGMTTERHALPAVFSMACTGSVAIGAGSFRFFFFVVILRLLGNLPLSVRGWC